MDHVFEILIHKIHDYGGTVNELNSDGMLAFFGVPITIEDAPHVIDKDENKTYKVKVI